MVLCRCLHPPELEGIQKSTAEKTDERRRRGSLTCLKFLKLFYSIVNLSSKLRTIVSREIHWEIGRGDICNLERVHRLLILFKVQHFVPRSLVTVGRCSQLEAFPAERRCRSDRQAWSSLRTPCPMGDSMHSKVSQVDSKMDSKVDSKELLPWDPRASKASKASKASRASRETGLPAASLRDRNQRMKGPETRLRKQRRCGRSSF